MNWRDVIGFGPAIPDPIDRKCSPEAIAYAFGRRLARVHGDDAGRLADIAVKGAQDGMREKTD